MVDRITYTDFKEELLLNMAILVRAETAKYIEPAKAALMIKERFSPSWTLEAARALKEDGLLKGSAYLGGGGSYALTGDGLQRAEEIATNHGTDLYELIDEDIADGLVDDEGNPLTDEHGNQLMIVPDPWSDNAAHDIMPIDHMSLAYKELDEALRERIDELRANNSFMAIGPESGQRISELEAGRALLKADQADRSLLERVLLPALKWIAVKVTDEAASKLIGRLLELLVAFLRNS